MNLIEKIATSSYSLWGCLGILILVVAGYLSLMTSGRFVRLRQNNQSVLWGLLPWLPFRWLTLPLWELSRLLIGQ